MYSYEDRIRAVRLYIKFGKRTSAVIRQLGYPTKNALKGWYREFEQCHDLTACYVRTTAKYSLDQKKMAVDHYLGFGRCLAATVKALGYPHRRTLLAWVIELYPEFSRRVVGKGGRTPQPLESKQAAVIELCTREESARNIAQKVGVSRHTLYKWKDQLLGREVPASMKRHDDSPHTPDCEELVRQVETLRRDIRQLQLEHDILTKANELLKKGQGIDLQLLSNREKTLLVDALRNIYALPELLVEIGLARSSYFYHRARLRISDKYAGLRIAIADIFKFNHRCYGYRRIREALGKQQVSISEKVVRRLMRQECIAVATTKRRRYSSYQGEIGLAPENLINRDFHASTPNAKWLTDITEFQIPAGKVYLSPVIDCFDGLVVSWSLGIRPDAQLVNTMLDAAIETVANSGERPIVHSDRGAHYRWPGWLSRMRAAKLVRSMSRKACSPDNAACEGFFGRLKTEMFYPRNWQATTIEQFIEAVDSYIRWYNETRIKISLGARSPLEYRASLGLAA